MRHTLHGQTHKHTGTWSDTHTLCGGKALCPYPLNRLLSPLLLIVKNNRAVGVAPLSETSSIDPEMGGAWNSQWGAVLTPLHFIAYTQPFIAVLFNI